MGRGRVQVLVARHGSSFPPRRLRRSRYCVDLHGRNGRHHHDDNGRQWTPTRSATECVSLALVAVARATALHTVAQTNRLIVYSLCRGACPLLDPVDITDAFGWFLGPLVRPLSHSQLQLHLQYVLRRGRVSAPDAGWYELRLETPTCRSSTVSAREQQIKMITRFIYNGGICSFSIRV